MLSLVFYFSISILQIAKKPYVIMLIFYANINRQTTLQGAEGTTTIRTNGKVQRHGDGYKKVGLLGT